jgi:hypothetical protein
VDLEIELELLCQSVALEQGIDMESLPDTFLHETPQRRNIVDFGIPTASEARAKKDGGRSLSYMD